MLPRIQKAKYKIAGKLPNDYYLDISRLSISCAQKPLGACPLLVAPLAVSFQCLPSVPLLPTSSGSHWHSAPCFNSSTGSGLRLLWRWSGVTALPVHASGLRANYLHCQPLPVPPRFRYLANNQHLHQQHPGHH